MTGHESNPRSLQDLDGDSRAARTQRFRWMAVIAAVLHGDQHGEFAGPGQLHPLPVGEVDSLVRVAVRRLRVLYLSTVAGFTAVLAAVVIIGLIQITTQGSELKASCRVWRSLAVLPVTAATPAKHPSRLGVGIVLSTRYAYQGQGCGKLPPADPSVVAGAAYWHLPVP